MTDPIDRFCHISPLFPSAENRKSTITTKKPNIPAVSRIDRTVSPLVSQKSTDKSASKHVCAQGVETYLPCSGILSVGLSVQAKFFGREWCDGVITKLNKNNTVNIHFDGGFDQFNVERINIRLQDLIPKHKYEKKRPCKQHAKIVSSCDKSFTSEGSSSFYHKHIKVEMKKETIKDNLPSRNCAVSSDIKNTIINDTSTTETTILKDQKIKKSFACNLTEISKDNDDVQSGACNSKQSDSSKVQKRVQNDHKRHLRKFHFGK